MCIAAEYLTFKAPAGRHVLNHGLRIGARSARTREGLRQKPNTLDKRLDNLIFIILWF